MVDVDQVMAEHLVTLYSPQTIYRAALIVLTRARDAEQAKVDRLTRLQHLSKSGVVLSDDVIRAEIEAVRR